MGIGWGGKTLQEMLAESESKFRETGYYYGLDNLYLKEKNPVEFERLFSRLRGSIIASRETAMRISASPIVRELGELCFALYSPEGDSLVLSTGVIVHGEAIKWMIRNNYEQDVKINAGDIFVNNDALIGGAHTSDVQTIIPVFHENELIAWVGAVTHVMEIGGIDAGGIAITTTNRFGDGLNFSCEKVGENDTLHRTYQVRCDRNLRGSVYWHLDERARIAGCHIMRDNLRKILNDFGVGYFKQYVREIIEDGRRSFTRKVKQTLFPGRYRATSFYDLPMKGAPLPSKAAVDTILHAPVEVTVKTDGILKIDMCGASKWTHTHVNSTLSAMKGGLWVALAQLLAYDGRINDGVYFAMEQNYPYGTWTNPDNPFVSLAGTWGPLMVSNNAVFRCISRAFFSCGFVEEVLAGFGHTGLIQWGGTDQYGNPMGGINFELCASGMGGRGIQDGLDTGYAMWNPESDMGDMEIWEHPYPQIYLGRRITPSSGGAGKYRGGNGFHSILLAWGSNDMEVGIAGIGKTFENCGIFGGYPSSRTDRYKYLAQNTNITELFKEKKPYPSFQADRKHNPLREMLKGDIAELDMGPMFPRAMQPGDVVIAHWLGGPGVGDPLDRLPSAVCKDLRDGHILSEFAKSVYGVVATLQPSGEEWEIDESKTRSLRKKIRRDRKKRGQPVADWWEQERKRILNGEISDVVRKMYAESMELNPAWAEAYRAFWNLPPDFKY